MKRIFFFINFYMLFALPKGFSQSNDKLDSILSVACNTLNESVDNADDTARLNEMRDKHIIPIISKMNPSIQEQSFDKIFYRLQRTCPEFVAILKRLEKPKGDWVTVPSKPKSKLNKKACRDFLKYKKYFYIEANGLDTIWVRIGKDYWMETMPDSTFSKLKFNWDNDTEFTIEFVESNNNVRKNFSRKGDKYNYQLIEKVSNYYKLSVWVVGQPDIMTFKLYFSKHSSVL